MRFVRSFVIVMGSMALVAACSSSSTSLPSDTSISIPSTTTVTTLKQPATFNGFKECEGSTKLQKVTASGTNVLGITWTTSSPLAGETAGYYVQAGPYQIGLRDLPGSEVARFVFDMNTAEQTDLTSSYILDGTTVQLIVPYSAVPKLDPSAQWTATISLNGSDVDSCVLVDS